MNRYGEKINKYHVDVTGNADYKKRIAFSYLRNDPTISANIAIL